MILYMFQCHSPKSSHLLPLPQSPKDCVRRNNSLFLCWRECFIRERKKNYRGESTIAGVHTWLSEGVSSKAQVRRLACAFGRWEWGSGWGTHVHSCLIHVNVCQKPLQYLKKKHRWGWGGAQKGGDICIPMADSCCCTAESDTTL